MYPKKVIQFLIQYQNKIFFIFTTSDVKSYSYISIPHIHFTQGTFNVEETISSDILTSPFIYILAIIFQSHHDYYLQHHYLNY